MKIQDEIIIHTYCGVEINRRGEDGIDYCPECEHICEGETQTISSDEYEATNE
jgi:ribosomal protein L37AE/L43A